MTNIIGHEMILPELTQSKVNAENIQSKIIQFIDDEKYCEDVKGKLKNVTSTFLTKTNSIENAAELIVKMR